MVGNIWRMDVNSLVPLLSFVFLCQLELCSGDHEVPLTFSRSVAMGTGRSQWEGRCPLPCNGSYSQGNLLVTLQLNTMVFNLETYGLFSSYQATQSKFWYLTNMVRIYENSNKICEFDVRFEHDSNASPVGTCQMDWVIPVCRSEDLTTCSDVVPTSLDQCYNQTILSQCCQTCTAHREHIENCPFGDWRPSRCDGISDNQCYQSNMTLDCCQTCHNIGRSYTELHLTNCPYGDRQPSTCPTIKRQDCYTGNYTCCYTCHTHAETSRPNCLYGNKRPDFCNLISTSDCYNPAIFSDCCETCMDIETLDANCRFGNKDPYCNDIGRQQCYNSTVERTCCDLCPSLRSNLIGCEYGDRKECWDITLNECENDQSVREKCCETCDYYLNTVPQCEENPPNFCSSIDRNACYNSNTESRCCQECRFHYDALLPDNCKYGDRRPVLCANIMSRDCYNSTIATDCCETCSYFDLDSLPDNCLYGDKENRCAAIPRSACYNSSTNTACCETCLEYDETDTFGYECRFGDVRNDCYTIYDTSQCYNNITYSACCQTCQNVADFSNPGCEYGDIDPTCGDRDRQQCYALRSTCCRTCQPWESHLPIDDCLYGDRQDCSGVTTTDCARAGVASTCCETCYFLLHQSASENNDTSCVDQNGANCWSVTGPQCYTRHGECCKTCLLQETGQDNCLYGDKDTNCTLILNTAYECYNPAVRDRCCATCPLLEISLSGDCRYGDRTSYCATINVSQCYSASIEEECCYSCELFKSLNGRPGCEYGDRYQFCNALSCSSYSTTRLQDCCYTCSNATSTSSTSTTTTIPSTTGTITGWWSTDSRTEETTRRQTTSKPTSTTRPGQTDEQSGSNNVPQIVGISVGVVALIIIVIVCVYCFVKRRNTPGKPTRSHYDMRTTHLPAPASSHVYHNPKRPDQPAHTKPTKPKSSEKADNEEVYDYINPDDVKTVASHPISRRPTLPTRPEEGQAGAPEYNGYLDPGTKTTDGVTNQGYTSTDAIGQNPHVYYTLQKDAAYNPQYS